MKLYKVIITYELIFIVFWNLLYLSNSDIENWFTGKKKPINVAWTWGTEGKDRSTWFDRNHQGLW